MPIYILEAEIVLGVLHRKGGIPKKVGTLVSNEYPGRQVLRVGFLVNEDGDDRMTMSAHGPKSTFLLCTAVACRSRRTSRPR